MPNHNVHLCGRKTYTLYMYMYSVVLILITIMSVMHTETMYTYIHPVHTWCMYIHGA